jgi:hypothetical protein
MRIHKTKKFSFVFRKTRQKKFSGTKIGANGVLPAVQWSVTDPESSHEGDHDAIGPIVGSLVMYSSRKIRPWINFCLRQSCVALVRDFPHDFFELLSANRS